MAMIDDVTTGPEPTIRVEFRYDVQADSWDWSPVVRTADGYCYAAGEHVEAPVQVRDGSPVHDAIDLSLRSGTPFSIREEMLDADGAAHDVLLCGLPQVQEGRAWVRGVVLELPGARAEPPRLTPALAALPEGVTPHDLPWDAAALPGDALAALNLCLEAGLPTATVWGGQRHVVYNEAYARLLPDDRHPALFGRSLAAHEVGLLSQCRPQVEQVFGSGVAHTLVEASVAGQGEASERESFVTAAFTPIRAGEGAVTGVHVVLIDTTPQVQHRRRLAELHALAVLALQEGPPQDLYPRLGAVLDDCLADVPFSLLYVVEPPGTRARLQVASGLPPGSPAAPETLRLDARGAQGWPVADAVAQSGSLVVDDVQQRFPQLVAGDADRPTHALLRHVAGGHDRLPDAITILGVGTRLAADAPYQSFLHKVAQHLHANLTCATSAQLDRERSANLQRAMESNRQIGAAIGILMTVHKVTEQQAFLLLSTASQRGNRKLREIAEDVVLSGALPAQGSSGS